MSTKSIENARAMGWAIVLFVLGTGLSAVGSAFRGETVWAVIFASLCLAMVVVVSRLRAEPGKELLLEDSCTVALLRSGNESTRCVCCPNSDRHIFGVTLDWEAGGPMDRLPGILRARPELEGRRIRFSIEVLPEPGGAK